jgi:hypothetical protein
VPSEEVHEIGRRGLIEALLVLDRVFSDSIDLPFNAYDHPEKVTFDDPAFPPKQFSFDLSGNFRRVDARAVTGLQVVELFVEVKSYSEGSQLLAEYDEFLRRAAIVGSMPRHRNSWFMFLSAVPFGTTFGVRLCDGAFLTERSQSWTGRIQPPQDLHLRTALVFGNLSLKRALDAWGHSR